MEKGAPWTTLEVKKFIALKNSGKTLREIADELGRPLGSALAYNTRFREKYPDIFPEKTIKHWSAEEVDKMLELRSSGLTYAEIGRRLGRTEKAVFHKMSELRKNNEKPKKI